MPRNDATEGPIEKSKWYENTNPIIDITIPNIQAIANRTPNFVENKADIIAGMIKNEKTTKTPAMRTATVMTMPNNA